MPTAPGRSREVVHARRSSHPHHGRGPRRLRGPPRLRAGRRGGDRPGHRRRGHPRGPRRRLLDDGQRRGPGAPQGVPRTLPGHRDRVRRHELDRGLQPVRLGGRRGRRLRGPPLELLDGPPDQARERRLRRGVPVPGGGEAAALGGLEEPGVRDDVRADRLRLQQAAPEARGGPAVARGPREGGARRAGAMDGQALLLRSRAQRARVPAHHPGPEGRSGLPGDPRRVRPRAGEALHLDRRDAREDPVGRAPARLQHDRLVRAREGEEGPERWVRDAEGLHARDEPDRDPAEGREAPERRPALPRLPALPARAGDHRAQVGPVRHPERRHRRVHRGAAPGPDGRQAPADPGRPVAARVARSEEAPRVPEAVAADRPPRVPVGPMGRPSLLRVSAVAGTSAVVLAPLGILVYQAFLDAPFFQPSARLSLDAFRFVFADPDFHRALRVTALVAAGMTALAVPLGSALALLVVRTDLPGRRLVEPWLLVPMLVSPVVLAFGYVVAVGPVGFVSIPVKAALGALPWDAYSLPSLVVVAGLTHAPHVYLYAGSALRAVGSDLEEAARVSGAGPLRVALTVSLPLDPLRRRARLLRRVRAVRPAAHPRRSGLARRPVHPPLHAHEQARGPEL